VCKETTTCAWTASACSFAAKGRKEGRKEGGEEKLCARRRRRDDSRGETRARSTADERLLLPSWADQAPSRRTGCVRSGVMETDSCAFDERRTPNVGPSGPPGGRKERPLQRFVTKVLDAQRDSGLQTRAYSTRSVDLDRTNLTQKRSPRCQSSSPRSTRRSRPSCGTAPSASPSRTLRRTW
jgi:hypothetical protein